MFLNEVEALNYIDTNKGIIIDELQEQQIKTIYTNENTRINIMRNGNQLLKVINRFDDDKNITNFE